MLRLVEIPGGTFQMGRNDGTPQERPQHPVTVQTVLMDRAEVTNEEYPEFVATGIMKLLIIGCEASLYTYRRNGLL